MESIVEQHLPSVLSPLVSRYLEFRGIRIATFNTDMSGNITTLAVVNNTLYTGTDRGNFQIWDLNTEELIEEKEFDEAVVEILPYNGRIITAFEFELNLDDLTLPVGYSIVGISPLNDFIVIATLGWVGLWDFKEVNTIYRTRVNIECMTVVNNMIVIGTRNNIIALTLTGGVIATLPTRDLVSAIVSLPNGMIAAGIAQGIVIWDPLTDTRTWLYEHTDRVTCLSVAQMTATWKLVSGSLDSSVRLWNEDGTLAKILTTRGPVTSITFTPDFELIAGSSKGLIEIWI